MQMRRIVCVAFFLHLNLLIASGQSQKPFPSKINQDINVTTEIGKTITSPTDLTNSTEKNKIGKLITLKEKSTTEKVFHIYF